MLLAPKYPRLDIPVFPPDTPVAIRPEFEYRAEQAIKRDPQNPTFIRAAQIRAMGVRMRNLADFLERTDRELDIVAGLCRAFTVEHSWGLYRVQPGEHGGRYDAYLPPRFSVLRVPRNHILVAEVAAIASARCLADMQDSDEYLQVQAGLAGYTGTDKFMAADMDPGQFDIGEGIKEADKVFGIWLADIEPRVSRVSRV